MCSRSVDIKMAMAIIIWRLCDICWLAVSVSSWGVGSVHMCVSAMSYPSSGILLCGIAFLPSLTFLTFSSSYS